MSAAAEAPDSGPPLTFQHLVGAAERLDARREERSGGWMAHVEAAYERLRREPFEAQPLPAFRHKDGEKVRILASPEPVERLIEEALVPLLHRALEPLLPDGVHGYRPGRSTISAAEAAAQALEKGQTHLAWLDVADFFPSIDRSRLEAQLGALLPLRMARLLATLAAAPLRLDGDLVERPQGLALGRPTSPLLANLYLAELDRALAEGPWTCLRYGDDLLLAAAPVEDRDRAEGRLRELLGALGLRVNEAKVRRERFDGSPVTYLGHAVDARGVLERVDEKRLERLRGNAEARRKAVATGPPEPNLRSEPPSNQRVQTLYVCEPGAYLSVQQGLVVARRGSATLREVPLHRVDRILLLSGATLSSGLMAACISAGVPILFFVGKGRAYGSLVAGATPNPLRLRGQYDLVGRGPRRLELARSVVAAKLDAMLLRLPRLPESEAWRARLAELRARVARAAAVPTLVGLEGAATRTYYESFARRVKREGFAFQARTRRPPRDPVNSLLSFSYALLFGEMVTALLAHGLDPHAGLLHDLRPGHPALASDLIEPYRVLVADAFVAQSINRGEVAPADFERHADGGVYLLDEARRRFLGRYEAWISPPAAKGGTRRELLLGAARAFLAVVLGESDELALPIARRKDAQEEDVWPAAS